MKTIQNVASSLFIVAVAILSAVSILGIWDFFNKDVITKSFETLGLLSIVSIVIIVAGRFVGGGEDPNTIVIPNPIFQTIRKVTLGVLIISAVLLTFLGICTIWDIISDKEILYKSLSSLGILAFSSFVIVITCLEREDSPLLKRNGKSSAGTIVGIIFLIYILFIMMGIFR
jgi:hypothetical protein